VVGSAEIRNLSRSRLNPAGMLWRVSRPLRSRSKPPGFIPPCQPALADSPPSGPGWLHEIKFDGYRVIPRKDGEQVRVCARSGAGREDQSPNFKLVRPNLPQGQIGCALIGCASSGDVEHGSCTE
jgi:hypothetical protein